MLVSRGHVGQQRFCILTTSSCFACGLHVFQFGLMGFCTWDHGFPFCVVPAGLKDITAFNIDFTR